MKAIGKDEERRGSVGQIGDLEIDVASGVIRKGGARLDIADQSARVLSALAQAAPETLSASELLARAWPGVTVGDDAVKQRVKLLRDALAVNGLPPDLIETVRGRGYRLGRAVAWSDSGVARTNLGVRALGAATVLLVAIVAAFALRPSSPAPMALYLTPVETIAAAEDDAAFIAGASAELRHQLGRLPDARLADEAPQMARAGDALIISVAFRRDGARRRLTFQAEDAVTGARVWSRALDLQTANGVVLERNLAALAAADLHARFGGDARASMKAHLAGRSDAYVSYLAALDFAAGKGPESFMLAIDAFDRALAEAPDFAMSLSGRASIHCAGFPG